MSDEILKERHGRVLVITINRPESRNAVNLAVSQGLADAVDELDENGDLSVAVITGAGRNFCSGMDLKAFAAGEVVAIPGRGIGFTERPPRLQKRIPFQKALELALTGDSFTAEQGEAWGWARIANFSALMVNVVSPGSIASEALVGWAESVGVDGGDPYALMAAIDKHFGHPAHMPRAGLPEEIGPVVAFLASRRNSYMTGANINVDGGSDFT